MESARLARKLNAVQNCQKAIALARARKIYGAECISASCSTGGTVYRQETPLESDVLIAKLLECSNNIIGTKCGPESSRIQAANQCVLDASVDSFNPAVRFLEYRGLLTPPVCPPVPTEVLNAYLPKASTRCIVSNSQFLNISF